MGSDNLKNGDNLNDNSAQIASPAVRAIASHIGRFYSKPKADITCGESETPYSINSTDEKTFVEKSSSVNHSTEICFESKHAPVGFDNPFFDKRVEA